MKTSVPSQRTISAEMLLAPAVLASVLLVCGIVLLFRALEAASWRRSLMALKLTVPDTCTTDDVARWAVTVSAMTEADHAGPVPLAVLPGPPVALELVGSKNAIGYYLLVPKDQRGALEAGLRSSIPGFNLEEAPDHLKRRPRFMKATEAALSSHVRPLDEDGAEAASIARLSALHPLHGDEEVWIQWIMTGAGIPAAVASVSARRRGDSWRLDNPVPPDPEAIHAARLKQQTQLLRTVVRVGVANTASKPRSLGLFKIVWAPFRIMNATGVGIVSRWWLPSDMVAGRMQRRALPLRRWPMTLNANELAGLLGLVSGDIRQPGLAISGVRPIPPTPDMPTVGTTIGMSDYQGMQDRPIALATNDRLRHMHVIGKTGMGKSTLLTGMALQDIAADHAVVLIDPKNDLVEGIADRYPDDRSLDDLIVVDASETDLPIAFNPLAVVGDETERELAVGRVLHVLREIYADSWGPRTDHVLRGALRTMVYVRALDGTPLTLCEVEPLLTNPAFRQALLQQPMPEYLRPFWAWYQRLRPTEQLTTIGPVLNKLSAFTDTPALRLMLGQSTGLDLSAVLEERRVLLLNLAKGRLGEEVAPLLGSLFVASLASAIQRRAHLPPSARHPVMVYIDEFQDVLKLGAVDEMLAQGRGLGASFQLAHQYLHQLPRDTAHAVHTTGSQVIFQVGQEDARVLARAVEPTLTARDLQNLGAHRIVLRPCVGGQTGPPVTATTLPLSEPTRDGRALAQASRERYGMPRQTVEAGLRARLHAAAAAQTFGRTPRREARP